jgi:cell division protein FtsN
LIFYYLADRNLVNTQNRRFICINDQFAANEFKIEKYFTGLMALKSFRINPFTKHGILILLLTATVSMLFSSPSYTLPPDEEIVLTFSHPAVGQYYITAIYSNNTVFLPAMEMFNLLYVHYEKGNSGHSLKGTWLSNDNHWEINTSSLSASSGKETFSITADDFRVGEMDLYLSPSLFERMFGLKFTINMSTLSVSLQSDKTLPIEEKKQHEDQRQQMQRRRENEKDYFLVYPRRRTVAGAGMADYNVGLYKDNEGVSGLYTLTGGMELLGGDIQSTVYGAAGQAFQKARLSNTSWRYALNENPYLTSVRAGQIYTTGLLNQRIVGGSISNDPIEPRKVYNSYSIDGNTVPDSEVELYINNLLTDYTRADELGYYRFSFSLTYGTVRINLRIYTPGGQIITEDRQLQIPFTFLPKGITSYNIQGGAIDDGLNDVTFNKYSVHGDIAYGLSNTITAKLGTDYFSFRAAPVYYGSLSARLFDQYLLDVDIAPNAYYRATATVTYASSRNISLNYTKFDDDSLFNFRRAKQEFDASVYLPFKIFGLQSGIRLSGENYLYTGRSLTNYNVDLNTRIGRINIRTNYRDQLSMDSENTAFGLGLVTGAVTYTFSRTPGIPVFVKGMFLRVQTQYDVRGNSISSAGLQFSRTMFEKGRFTLNVDHYFDAKSTFVQAGFILDLNSVRSNSQFTSFGKGKVFQQTFNGSVGLDSKSAKLKASNREQVSRAAVSVLMYIDSNDNHIYDPGEEKISARAIRLRESATIELGRDSILRITQLQSYWKYNAEIIQSALPNPTVAPAFSQFSFVADPNRYKRIEIPFYKTGVIDGKVILVRDSTSDGIGGIRLLLKRTDKSYEETIRTFTDGGYYAMNLMPGTYTLEPDSVQLGFLAAKSRPDKLEFEIKVVSGGDYITNPDIMLVSKPGIMDTAALKEKQVVRPIEIPVVKPPEKPIIRKDTTVMIVHEVVQETITVSEDIYAIQLGAFKVRSNAEALRVKLEKLLGRKVDIISEGDLFKVRINDIKERKDVDEYVNVLHRNGINELWVISLKAKQKQLILGQKTDTVTTINETIIQRPAEEVSTDLLIQAGAFRLRSNAIALRDKLAHTFDKNVIITSENGFYKVRVAGMSIMKAIVLDEMKKLMPDSKLGTNDLWVLPVTTPVTEEVPVKIREAAPEKTKGNMEVSCAAPLETARISLAGVTEAPLQAIPKISLQVGVFTKKSEALRAQKKISKKFSRDCEIVQRYEYYLIIIPGFWTRQETFKFYPELTQMGYTKISVVEKK